MGNITTKKNIAMFGHKRIPSREGGVEIVVEELATRMARLGHKVVCYNRTGHHVSDTNYDLTKIKEHKGVKIKSVLTVDKKGLAAVTSSFFAAIRCAFSKAEVVHIHAEGPAVMTSLLKLFNKRVIVTVHGLDWQRDKWSEGFASKYIKLGEKTAVKHADEIIVLSKRVQDYFKETYKRDTVYIPNAVSKPEFSDAKLITDSFGLTKDSYILFLGRLVPEKGVHLLIDAFKTVNTDKKLVIAGGTSDTDDYVSELIKKAQTDDRIVFAGFQQGKMLEELYSNAYIYVLPSLLEGMPLSLLEAMSYSNCCVVSDIAECKEVVEDKAIVVKANDINSLIDALQKLCDNAKLVNDFRSCSQDYILNKYNWDNIVERTLALY